jgi:hypothetical protein
MSRRRVITLSPVDNVRAEHLSRSMGIRVPDVVRQGLALLAEYADLDEGEAMLIRRADGSLERVVLVLG